MGQTFPGLCCCNTDSDENKDMKIALGEECQTILNAGYNLQPIDKRAEKQDQ